MMLRLRSVLARDGLALVLLAVGGGLLTRPALLAKRFAPVDGVSPELFAQAAHAVVLGLAAALLVLGLAALVRTHGPRRMHRCWCVPTAALALVYLCLTWPLRDWQVDDAAITFAYSENLVRGHGLVLHPALPREEAYSNSLWMLLLAGLRALGLDVELAAKLLGTAVGVATVVLTLRVIQRLEPGNTEVPSASEDSARLTAIGATLLTAPFVIWTVSGLEHGLQAFVLLAAVGAYAGTTPRPWQATVALAALVLLRPEAPLLVAAFTLVLLLHERRAGRALVASARRLAPVALVPALTFAALIAFRLAYFGDPVATPYYAKASDATLLRIVNLVGGGWDYVLSWLRTGAVFVIAPALAMSSLRRSPLAVQLAAALTFAQLIFVVGAGGDWMSHWRFLAPVAPLLALIFAEATRQARARWTGGDGARLWTRATWVMAAVLALASLRHLLAFRAAPTTPVAVVSNVGLEFVALAQRLGIANAKLAHHDAGGTSYRARIELVDLGGLGNRYIAKHMTDAPALERYLFDSARPDFVFGSATRFAAGTLDLAHHPRFLQDYVRVEFSDCPVMTADLCHVRRDRLNETALERVLAQGQLVAVRVPGCLGPR